MFKIIKKSTLIFLGITLLFVILIVWFIIKPQIRKSIASYKDYQTKTDQSKTIDASISQLEQVSKQYQQVRDLADKIDKYIPSTDDIPDLVIQLETLASDTGNQFPNFTITKPTANPSQSNQTNTNEDTTETKKTSFLKSKWLAFAQTANTNGSGADTNKPAGYQKIDLQISLVGSFSSLRDYLTKFYSLSRLAGISSITIAVDSSSASQPAGSQPAPATSGNLNTEIKAFVFTRASGTTSASPSPTPAASTTPSTSPTKQ